MDASVKINDVIALNEDIVSENLVRGSIGRVLQVFSLDEFEVDFADYAGQTIAKIPLRREQFTVFRHEATLDENSFWQLIEDAKKQSNGNSKRQVGRLVNKLAKMSVADIFIFDAIFDRIQKLAYREDLWDASDIIAGGLGDDSFSDFRYWLVAQGKQVFYNALNNPESLVEVVPSEHDIFAIGRNVSLQIMSGVADDAYWKKTGEVMPLFVGIYLWPELVKDESKVAAEKNIRS